MAYTVAQAEAALAALQEKRQAALNLAKQITDDVSSGKRSADKESDSAYNKAWTEYTRLGELEKAARSDLADARSDIETANAFASSISRAGLVFGSTIAPAQARYGRAFSRGQGFVDLAPKRATLEETGNYLRAMVLDDVQTRATMVTGTPTAAGYLVPIAYSAVLMDLAMAQAQVVKAGATVVPLDSTTHKIPRLDARPTFAFRNEAAAITESGVTVGEVTFTPRSAATLVRVSNELMQDSSVDMGLLLAQSISEAAAGLVDQKSLYGSGTAPEVKGLKNQAGLVVTNLGANGAALTNYDALVDLVARVRGLDYPVTGIVTSPRLEGTMGKMREGAGTGQYLAKPGYLDMPILSSSNVPINLSVGTSGAVCTDAFAGDWSQLFIGWRQTLELQVLREAYASTGETGFIATIRFDVQVGRIAALQALSGINN